MTYLLAGHTHDKIDRFFSRVKAAVAGRDYYTIVCSLILQWRSLCCNSS